jgi:catechol 2,3-dioxygenase-like lactoylglutathione lyase family enzyme
MLESVPAVAFLPSTDLGRSREFFADTLGLPLVEETPFACVLQAGPTMLRVTKVDELHPQPFTVFGWVVADITGTVKALMEAGVRMLDYHMISQTAEGVWTTPGGDRVAWFNDPEGNVLSLTQFAS